MNYTAINTIIGTLYSAPITAETVAKSMEDIADILEALPLDSIDSADMDMIGAVSAFAALSLTVKERNKFRGWTLLNALGANIRWAEYDKSINEGFEVPSL